MAPSGDEKIILCNPENYFSGEMSTAAAGITVCLYSLSCLSLTVNEDDRDALIEHYYRLLDYAHTLEEGGLIASAID